MVTVTFWSVRSGQTLIQCYFEWQYKHSHPPNYSYTISICHFMTSLTQSLGLRLSEFLLLSLQIHFALYNYSYTISICHFMILFTPSLGLRLSHFLYWYCKFIFALYNYPNTISIYHSMILFTQSLGLRFSHFLFLTLQIRFALYNFSYTISMCSGPGIHLRASWLLKLSVNVISAQMTI